MSNQGTKVLAGRYAAAPQAPVSHEEVPPNVAELARYILGKQNKGKIKRALFNGKISI